MITLERTACLGTCPIYKLSIYGDGRVIYEGIRFVKIEGTVTTTISEEKIKQLVTEFQSIDYFSLNDSYEEFNATDMPSAMTSLTVGGKTKTIRHYHGDFSAPKKLTELENKIDHIVFSDQ
jgi:(2Fe-2S) ferredoxin